MYRVCDKNYIENEFHFVFICPLYYDLRPKFILKNYYTRNPSILKLIQLFNLEHIRENINT